MTDVCCAFVASRFSSFSRATLAMFTCFLKHYSKAMLVYFSFDLLSHSICSRLTRVIIFPSHLLQDT
jgi:hypothetical protein